MQISGILIKIQDKKYAIDMVKARELYYQLDELFGTKDTTYIPYPVTTPQPVIYPQPYYTDDMWKWCPSTTIYGGTTSIATGSSDNELRIDNWDLSASSLAYAVEEADDVENYFEIEVDLEEITNE